MIQVNAALLGIIVIVVTVCLFFFQQWLWVQWLHKAHRDPLKYGLYDASGIQAMRNDIRKLLQINILVARQQGLTTLPDWTDIVLDDPT
jgi:hypothetical protein